MRDAADRNNRSMSECVNETRGFRRRQHRQWRQSAPPSFVALALGSVGVVYGDIGTSPLYAFREAAMAASQRPARSPATSCSACCR